MRHTLARLSAAALGAAAVAAVPAAAQASPSPVGSPAQSGTVAMTPTASGLEFTVTQPSSDTAGVLLLSGNGQTANVAVSFSEQAGGDAGNVYDYDVESVTGSQPGCQEVMSSGDGTATVLTDAQQTVAPVN